MQLNKITESQLQIAFFEYCRTRSKYEPEWGMIFAIPMQGGSGRVNMIRSAKMKLEGASRGVPDFFVAVPRGKSSGLFVELKLPSGTLSPEQKAWQEKLTKQGYVSSVIKTEDVLTVIRHVEDYFADRTIKTSTPS